MSFDDDNLFDPIIDDEYQKAPRSHRKQYDPFPLSTSNKKSQSNLLGPQNQFKKLDQLVQANEIRMNKMKLRQIKNRQQPMIHSARVLSPRKSQNNIMIKQQFDDVLRDMNESFASNKQLYSGQRSRIQRQLAHPRNSVGIMGQQRERSNSDNDSRQMPSSNQKLSTLDFMRKFNKMNK